MYIGLGTALQKLRMKRVYAHCIQRFSALWSSVLLCSGHAMMFVSCHVRAVSCSRALSCSCHVPRAMVVVPCLCRAIMCVQCHVRALPCSCAVLFSCRAIFVPCYFIAIALGNPAKKTWALLLAKVAVLARLARCFRHLVGITSSRDRDRCRSPPASSASSSSPSPSSPPASPL